MERRFVSTRKLNFAAPAIVFLAFMATTFSAWIPIGERWTRLDESYSHGFLLLLISVFLFVRTFRREQPVAAFYPLWIVPLVGALLLYVVGDILMIQAAQQIVLVPLLLGGFAIIWGWRQVRAFIVPVGIVFFAIPVWDFISWPLQLITVVINQILLGIPGIEFEVEGVFVYLIGVGAFEIAHGCSGLRYLLVGLTLAVLYGELNYRHWSSKVLMISMAIAFALVANWLRVFIIIYMGYITDMETGLIEDHDTFGWYVFAGTLVPLFLFGRWLEKRPWERVEQASGIALGKLRGPGLAGALVVAGIFLLTAVGVASGDDPVTGETRTLSLSPMPGDNWSPLFQRQLQGWEPRIQRPDWVYRATFFNSEGMEAGQQPDMKAKVALYTYEYQRAGREVVQFGNRVYDTRVWHPERTYGIATNGGANLRGLNLRLRGSDEYLYIAYGYYVEGRWETDELLAKLAQLQSVFNPRSDASFLAVGLACKDCDGEKELKDLVNEIQPSLQKHLDERFGE